MIIELKIRNTAILNPSSKFRLMIEHNGKKTEECIVDYDTQSSAVVLTSGYRNELEKGALFTLFVEVFDEDSEMYGTYSHIQSIFGKVEIPRNFPFAKLKGLSGEQ